MKTNIFSVRVCTHPHTTWTVEYKAQNNTKPTVRTYTDKSVPATVLAFCNDESNHREVLSSATSVYYQKEETNVQTWETTPRPVTLTNEQWSLLTCYILMTTQHRKKEREAWESLAKETNEDGTPTFKNAASNAEFYEELETKLEEIRLAIDKI